MNILISQMSQTPIYEQMEEQIRRAVLSGDLQTGEAMPSIRKMAKDLGVGIITVKRAYDDLCSEGLLISLQGRGVFVADVNLQRKKQIQLEQLEERLLEIRKFCRDSSITKEELQQLFDQIMVD